MDTAELLSEKICRAVAEDNGWSPAYAEGYVWGQSLRLQDKTIESHALVGIDDWALGFRTGYFGQESQASSRLPVAGTSETERKRRRILTN